ncbi:sigma factor-like helix-turn-helix DNA-binding protein [Streptomyces canus]|uniref:sigma-70 region 4 domain-containing protein n=1 Tax=Streptomyces canus TaxID=58343 RepID=UPI0033D0A21B
MVSPPQARPNSAVTADEAAECLRLRRTGMSIDRIAEHTGLSHGTVHNRISRAVKDQVQPEAEEYRAMQEGRLDDALRIVYRVLFDPEADPDTRLRAVDRLVKIEERRARLLGLDAPVKSEATITAQFDADASGMLAVIVASITAASRALEADRAMPVHLIEQYGLQYAQYEMARLAGDDVGMPPEPPKRVVSGRVLPSGTGGHRAADSAIPMPAPAADTDESEDADWNRHEIEIFEAEIADGD